MWTDLHCFCRLSRGLFETSYLFHHAQPIGETHCYSPQACTQGTVSTEVWQFLGNSKNLLPERREMSPFISLTEVRLSDRLPSQSYAPVILPECACISLIDKRVVAIPIWELCLPEPHPLLYSNKKYSAANYRSSLQSCRRLTSDRVTIDLSDFKCYSFPLTCRFCFFLLFPGHTMTVLSHAWGNSHDSPARLKSTGRQASCHVMGVKNRGYVWWTDFLNLVSLRLTNPSVYLCAS